MIGAHPYYVNRYPPQFRIWDDDAIPPTWVTRRDEGSFRSNKFNQYDNAVRYTDDVVGKVLDLAERYEVASVTFLSDHGQNLGELSDHWGHSMPSGPRQGFKVPLIFWINKDYIATNKLALGALESNSEKPFQMDDLLYTWLDLYRIASPNVSMVRSLFAQGRLEGTRRCDSMKY